MCVCGIATLQVLLEMASVWSRVPAESCGVYGERIKLVKKKIEVVPMSLVSHVVTKLVKTW